MYTELRRKAKVGYFGSGLAAYWPQFPELRPAVMETMAKHRQRLEAMGCEVVDGGLVDAADKSNGVGDLFAREQVDLIIGEIMTYTASHVLIPIAQRNIAPYLTLALADGADGAVRGDRDGGDDADRCGDDGAGGVVRVQPLQPAVPLRGGGRLPGEGLEERGGVDRGSGGEAGAARQPAGLPGALLPGDAGHVHGLHDAPGIPGHAHRDRGDVRPGGQGEEGE